MDSKKCTWDEAATEVRAVDEQRRHFVSTWFHSDLNDAERYDMVFNTDRITVEEGAHLIAHLVSSPGFRDRDAQKLRELRERVLG
jgi:cytidylate kinase